MSDASITYVPTDADVDMSTLVCVRGTANLARDPKFRSGGDRILRVLPLADLPLCIGRWLDMGRTVTSVHTWMGW